jgi:outer membrane protein TolC
MSPAGRLIATATLAAAAASWSGAAYAQLELSSLALQARVSQVPPPPAPPWRAVTFDEAVREAMERNPTVAEAAQAILRAESLLSQAKTVFQPQLTGAIGITMLDDARGFGDQVFQPRTQTAFNATVSYPVLAAARWAQKTQAGDRVLIARISMEETRRQVAIAAAQAYLAVIAAKRQQEIQVRNRDTARALADYSQARLDAGQGSRLNNLRSQQELATAEGLLEVTELAITRSQEALGVAMFADGPVDAASDPTLPLEPPPTSDGWLNDRTDVRLFSQELKAADRIVADNWKSWLPTAEASFTPLYTTPATLFQPSKSWRAFFSLELPIYDGTLGAAKKFRVAERDSAKLRLDALTNQARSELRLAQEAVARAEHVVASARRAAEVGLEALRITEIAYRAGATTNIEVIQQQQTTRNVQIAEAVAEDRLRQAKLDLAVALGRFPR